MYNDKYSACNMDHHDTMVVTFATKCRKYTVWDVFFISLTDMTFLFNLTK